jgi:hypothetical protein
MVSYGKYDFLCTVGKQFDEVLTFKDKSTNAALNLTSCTALMKVVDKDTSELLMTFKEDDNTLVITRASGIITLHQDAEVTTLFTSENAIYELEVYNGSGNVLYGIEGEFKPIIGVL